jgi:hypothetical protein
MKIVVFDLDETLGYFVEFGILWDCLNLYLSKNNISELQQPEFIKILDLYPEFLRPNIMNILDYLKNKKQTQCCQKLMIYTNNQGHQNWTNNIVSYFETKMKYKLFDKIISAFKINGKRIEVCRTTNNKTYDDFIRCTMLPKNAKICYLDDTFYPEMMHESVYYINIKPYIHDLPFDEMYNRFLECSVGKQLISEVEREHFINFMEKNIKLYNFEETKKDIEDYKIDTILSKRILLHLHEFFGKTNNSGSTNKIISKPKTLKKYYNNKAKNKSSKKTQIPKWT